VNGIENSPPSVSLSLPAIVSVLILPITSFGFGRVTKSRPPPTLVQMSLASQTESPSESGP
jgi:hypothetical protein